MVRNVTLTIDHKSVTVPENTTILEAARSVNINIPTLCYLKDINEIGACRICCVEVEGMERLVPACDNVVADGMVVFTNSAKAHEPQQIVDAALAELDAAAEVDAQRPADEATSDLKQLELAGDCLEVSSGAHA